MCIEGKDQILKEFSLEEKEMILKTSTLSNFASVLSPVRNNQKFYF